MHHGDATSAAGFALTLFVLVCLVVTLLALFERRGAQRRAEEQRLKEAAAAPYKVKGVPINVPDGAVTTEGLRMALQDVSVEAIEITHEGGWCKCEVKPQECNHGNLEANDPD